VGSFLENLAQSGGDQGSLRHASQDAFIANLSKETLLLTALLPADATAERRLMLSIMDATDPAMAEADPFQTLKRERTLRPGEVARFSLRSLPDVTHTSLFRARRQGHAGSCFLKYTVTVAGAKAAATIQIIGTHDKLGQVEQPLPHFLRIR
jgi:hypothetical protein